MPWRLANPDRLFDRTWRPRHPLRPRLSAARRWGTLTLLILLATTILLYSWLTDTRRVRAMAGGYLSDLLGADVEIRSASLSIFEGLRLDDVTVRVEGGYHSDSTVFHAQTVLIRYNPAELLTGKLSATEIIAIAPTVLLVEDSATHRWNYQRLWHGMGAPPRHTGFSTGPAILPTIILRDAQVAYLQMRDNRTQTVGWYSLEGRLSPGIDADDYDLELQSRGRESLGPSVDGTINTAGGPSVFRMRNFTFGPDIMTMLLTEPRAWCERHQLQGRIDVPEMVFTPGKDGADPSFRLEIALSSVELAISPQEWMSRQQNLNVDFFHQWLESLSKKRWFPVDLAPAMRRLSTPEPIHMRQVSGTLVFTDQGLELKSVNGRLENNWFNVDGRIDGYSPDAAASLTVSSLEGHDLEIPAWSPTYAGSLPPEVQEIYERLHPQGTCAVSVTIDRKESGSRPDVTGRIDILDGQFRFSDFPYLLTGATGAILIGPDPIAKMDGIRIVNVHGHGVDGGPNANAVVSLDGFIGPMDQVAGVWLDVRGKNLVSEPAIRAALPATADRALRLFDPAGNGEFPKFRGDMLCHIYRPIGQHKHWEITTDVNLTDAEGTLVFFPYPMKGVTGRLEIRDDFLNIVNLQAAHGQGMIAINGKVTWKSDNSRATTQPVGPELRIIARDLPLDGDLRNALPPQERDWLQSAGASGTLDVEGRVFPVQAISSDSHGKSDVDVDYAFDASLRDGKLWPIGDEFGLSDITGKVHITPREFLLTNVLARHGKGIVNGRVAITVGDKQPKIEVDGSAQQLPMDAALYAMLPQSARDAWDGLKPQGQLDATLQYETTLPDPTSTLPTPPDQFDVQLRPRDLAITPSIFPYRLEKVQGLLDVSPGKVTIGDVSGQHGPTLVSFSGQADLGDHPQWNLKLSAKNLGIDDDFEKAAPDIVSQVISTLSLKGKLDVDFSNLAYRPLPQIDQDSSGRQSHGADMDFAAKVTLKSASLDVGLPATDVNATMDVAGLVRDGQIHRLAAQLTADSLKLAGAPATNFQVELSKSSDDNLIQVAQLEGQFAGGDLSGDGQMTYSDSGPGRYDFSVVLHDADVQQLAGRTDKNFKGRLTASLEMGGPLNDISSRRGHGDVHVYGQNMYNLPILLGLLQITNLALPLSSPFSEATSRYVIDGQQVSFESIDLMSKDMTMSGEGHLDFAERTVSLWFVTDNPALVNLPIVGALIHGAKQELLRIHISGTIEQPKVSASTFNTVTTTVDQVLRNGEQK